MPSAPACPASRGRLALSRRASHAPAFTVGAAPALAFALLAACGFALPAPAEPAPALSPPPAPGFLPTPAPATAILAEGANDRLDRAPAPGLYFGATWLDLDGDGDLDLTVPADSGSTGFLTVWRNDGGFFHDVTAALGLQGVTEARSAVWLDLDDDGDLDLYVTRRSDAPDNLLFENAGGAMRRRPGGLGFDAPATDVSQSWADYDGDGDLDLYLPGVFLSRPRLLRNDGGFRFADVSVAAGLDTLSQSLDAAWGDFDADGDPDLAIGEVFTFRFYENLGGGRFREVRPPIFATPALLASPSWADVDGDGDLDLYVGGLFPPRLFENRWAPDAPADSFFADRTLDWGSGPPFGGGGTWADLDLDGDLDLLADGGSIGTRLFENLIAQGDGLLDVTAAAGLPFVRTITWFPTAGDFDGDGRIDFFAAQEIGPTLYRNISQVAGNALALALVPRRGGVPLGARVTLELDGRTQMREVAWAASGFSFPAPQVVLALGGRRTAPWVEVRWASGLAERFHGLRAGRLETLVEGRGQPVPGGRRGPRRSLTAGLDGEAGGAGDAVAPGGAIAPGTLALSCNPCRETLAIRLAESPAPGTPIRIHDVRGRVVRTLVPRGAAATWDLRDDAGARVRPGMYWLRAAPATTAGPPARVVVLP